MLQTFGELFRELRLKAGFSLREYCRRFGEDPPFISKMERGKVPPPTSHEKLQKMALSVDLKEDTEEWGYFFTSAIVGAGRIPKEAMDDEQVLRRLPVLLRTMTGQKLSEDQLDALVEVVRDA